MNKTKKQLCFKTFEGGGEGSEAIFSLFFLVNIYIKTTPKCVTVKIRCYEYVSVGTKRSTSAVEDG